MTTATQFEYVKLKRVTTAERDVDWPPGTIPTDISLLIFNTDLETMQFTEDGVWLTLPPHLATIADEQHLEYDAGTKTFRAQNLPHRVLDTQRHTDAALSGEARGAIIVMNSALEWTTTAGITGGALQYNGTDTTFKVAKRTVVLTARGILPNETEGCAPVVRVEGSNGANYAVADFASGEEGSWDGATPPNWDGGTVTFQVHEIVPTGASASDTVIWGLKGLSIAHDDAIDASLGSQVTVTNTVTAAGDLLISSVSSAVTLAGSSPTGGESFIFEIERTGGTMSEEARLFQVVVFYDTDDYSDE